MFIFRLTCALAALTDNKLMNMAVVMIIFFMLCLFVIMTCPAMHSLTHSNMHNSVVTVVLQDGEW
jgi:cell division protein FtsX